VKTPLLSELPSEKPSTPADVARLRRTADHPIEPLLMERWSPRAMSGEPLAPKEILTLFEAARWAPSTYNEQEWRFLYARRNTEAWPLFFGLLMEANQVWCRNAGLLCLIAAKKTLTQNGKPNPVHLFDCGNAFENLALQGTAMGLVVHGMAGFDFEKAKSVLKIPEDFEVAAMFAAGHPADPALLPEELREKEQPSGRKPLNQIICEGTFALA
jgi:nitroreductase